MSGPDFKINDIVRSALTGRTYKIYASKEIAYEHAGVAVSPNEFSDFVICEFPLEAGELEFFLHVPQSHLLPLA